MSQDRKKMRHCGLKMKTISMIFCNYRGVMRYELLKPSHAVNKEYYLGVVRRLREAIRIEEAGIVGRQVLVCALRYLPISHFVGSSRPFHLKFNPYHSTTSDHSGGKVLTRLKKYELNRRKVWALFWISTITTVLRIGKTLG